MLRSSRRNGRAVVSLSLPYRLHFLLLTADALMFVRGQLQETPGFRHLSPADLLSQGLRSIPAVARAIRP